MVSETIRYQKKHTFSVANYSFGDESIFAFLQICRYRFQQNKNTLIVLSTTDIPSSSWKMNLLNAELQFMLTSKDTCVLYSYHLHTTLNNLHLQDYEKESQQGSKESYFAFGGDSHQEITLLVFSNQVKSKSRNNWKFTHKLKFKNIISIINNLDNNTMKDIKKFIPSYISKST